VAMATGGAAWGAGVVPMRGGAGFRVSARWRSTTGGRGRRLVKGKRERERGFYRFGLGLLFLLPIQADTTSSRSLARFDAGLSLVLLGEALRSICIGGKRKKRENRG
jgi:hypothetical protein